MNLKTIVNLLLLFSFFVSCLPAPKLLLVETEGGEEGDDRKAEGGKGVDYQQVRFTYNGGGNR